MSEAIDRLRAAIEGERRHWHTVEVRPDDIAALLDAIRQCVTCGRPYDPAAVACPNCGATDE